jgi:hypothetical protein
MPFLIQFQLATEDFGLHHGDRKQNIAQRRGGAEIVFRYQ